MPPQDEHGAVIPQSGSGRLRYIDALRGIAALLVLWLHVANSFRAVSPQTASHVRWLNDFITEIDIGRVGVVVFFLISGFVIPFSIRPGNGAPVGSFVIRRVFRIYPAYWLSVPLAAWVFFWYVGAPFSSGELLANLTLLQSLFGVRHAEGVYWTLVVELAFYALCIALLLTRSLYSARRIALLAAALAIMHVFAAFMLWLKHPVVDVAASFWPLNLSVMLWGALYRLDATSTDRFASAMLRLLAAFYVLVLPIGAALATHAPQAYAISYALAVVVFVLGTRVVRIETRLTDWLGRISYSIYLFHPIVFQPIYLWLMQQPGDSPWRTQHLAVYLVANLVLTLIAASLVFRFVERPAIRLGHRLATRYEQRASRRLRRDADAPSSGIAEAAVS
jgi:peptidoglycan/LPS O-acetylase OafA/YrhL